jgi:hypothetical protein
MITVIPAAEARRVMKLAPYLRRYKANPPG